MKYMRVDPYSHGAWAKDCNDMYLFSAAMVKNKFYVAIVSKP